MQSSSGLINIHELRWLGDWLVALPAAAAGRQAHSSAAFVWQTFHSVQSVSDMWKIFIQ